MNLKELEDNIRGCIRAGLSKYDIVRVMNDKYSKPEVVEDAVERTCEEYGDYELIQVFMNSKIISDKVAEDDSLYMYNPISHELKSIARNRLSSMISSKLKWDHRRYTCDFVYDPINCFKLRKVGKFWEYNLYEPPEWYAEFFYSENRKLPVVSSPPELYDRFLRHLVDDHVVSYEYVLDWLANMLQARNFCVLTTIGNKGIGKGVLGDIMKELVGAHNWAKTDNKIVEKDFNAQIINKRLTYLNEVRIKTAEQENKFKALIDPTIEVEQKGIDAKQITNHSSIYLSSNNLDAVPVTSDNRRLSIVMLTAKKLTDIMTVNEIKSLTENKELIKQFGIYLMNRSVDSDRMMRPLESPRTEVIRSARLNAWQEWFIEEWLPDQSGKTFAVREVTEIVEEEWGSNCRPGRGAFQNLEQSFSNLFKVKKIRDSKNKNKQVWVIEFY